VADADFSDGFVAGGFAAGAGASMAFLTGSAILSVVTTRSDRRLCSAHSRDRYGQVC
jgi:hypothetical protein